MGDDTEYQVVGKGPRLLHIERLHAFIAQDKDGNEGVSAFYREGIGWIPMVGADPERVESLKEEARKLVKATGMRITLCVFEQRKEVEVIEP